MCWTCRRSRQLAEARELGEAVPRDLRGVLDLDLARPAPGLDGQVLRAVARALAFAEGSGMPEQVSRARRGRVPAQLRSTRSGLGSGETQEGAGPAAVLPAPRGRRGRQHPVPAVPPGPSRPAARRRRPRHHRGHRPRPGRPGLAAPVRDDPRWPGRIAAVAARRALPAAARRPARRRRRASSKTCSRTRGSSPTPTRSPWPRCSRPCPQAPPAGQPTPTAPPTPRTPGSPQRPARRSWPSTRPATETPTWPSAYPPQLSGSPSGRPTRAGQPDCA